VSRQDRDTPPHILIVDDEAFIRSSFKLYFESVGFTVSIAEGGESALAVFREKSRPVDVVLLDLVMPGMTGIDVLRRFKELNDDVEVIIATGCGSMHTAVEALRHGAYDYITKPILNFDDDLLRVVDQALAERSARLLAKRPKDAEDRAGRPPPAENPLAFYEELESIARKTIGSSRAESTAAIGAFLARSAGVSAAAVLERREDGAFSTLARWGAFAGDRRADALLATGSPWPRSLPAASGWTCLPAEDPASDLLGAAGGAEILRVTLPVAATATGGPVRDVILLRRHAGGSSPRAPAAALLALVLERSASLPGS
jgi:CheY-like chemotaxis protein